MFGSLQLSCVRRTQIQHRGEDRVVWLLAPDEFARTTVVCSRGKGYRAPSTESFNALAGVNRKRVRAGILICSPVAGLGPKRALSLRLRNTPTPAKPSKPSFLGWRETKSLRSASGVFTRRSGTAALFGR